MVSCVIHEQDPLNSSDHLPLTVTLNHMTATMNPSSDSPWRKAQESGAVSSFQASLMEKISPFADSMFSSVVEIEDNIQLVSEAVKETALETLPLIRPKKGRFFKDPTLKQMTVKSKAVWKAWSDAGRPSEGPLHDSKLFWHREVRKRINVYAAMAEC